jgi:SAM-dependent methyltransferase
MYTVEHLANLRLYELERISAHLAKGSTLLEIGAGAGWQSKELSRRGVDVTAIDIPTSYYKPDQIWPVIEYDGVHIPFPDDHFDIVFSSNVLEHIPHVRSFQSELQRVLKSNGIAIHILPSGMWRLWSSIAHYPWIVSAAFNRLFKRRAAAQIEGKSNSPGAPAPPRRQVIREILAPTRHGEVGNVITETYYFSKFRWFRLFRATGWRIEYCYSNRLFYTGYSVLDSTLSIRSRHLLSYFLGSACHVFILKKQTPAARLMLRNTVPGQNDRRHSPNVRAALWKSFSRPFTVRRQYRTFEP